MKIVLGVGAGIAAYKVVSLLRLLTESGHRVKVVPSTNSFEFIGKTTWEALSGQSVNDSVFSDVPQVAHIKIAESADLVVVAPTTADLLAKFATGQASDLLTTTVISATCPIVLVPAMHTQMWLNPATVRNVATLRGDGIDIMTPASGRLTGSDSGIGRLPEATDIFDYLQTYLAPKIESPLAGKHVVISAGPTREPIDPVRYITNHSSGKQGIALAQEAKKLGAKVTLLAANLSQDLPPGIEVVQTPSAAELLESASGLQKEADVIIMAAAVADYRASQIEVSKIKKSASAGKWILELEQNPDILQHLVKNRQEKQVIVGFAAETGDHQHDYLTYGKQKAVAKGADYLVINPVGNGQGFGTEDNTITIVDASGQIVNQATGLKTEIAETIFETISKHPNLVHRLESK